MAKQGTKVEMAIDIDLAYIPYCSQFVPVLARVDVIAGRVTGPVADQDASPPRATAKSFEAATGRPRQTCAAWNPNFGGQDTGRSGHRRPRLTPKPSPQLWIRLLRVVPTAFR